MPAGLPESASTCFIFTRRTEDENCQPLVFIISIMRCQHLLAAAALVAPVFASPKLKVEQYKGPTECPEELTVKPGDHLSIHYIGTIDESSDGGEQGKKFDSSRDRDDPYYFQIGKGMAFPGWDEGLLGMCVGAKATLVVPADMAYGDHGAGDIPPGATINFDVEVLGIHEGLPPPPNYFIKIDKDKDGFLDEAEIEGFFNKQGKEVPEELWENEDKDGDNKISWDEFSGPKGDYPGDEL